MICGPYLSRNYFSQTLTEIIMSLNETSEQDKRQMLVQQLKTLPPAPFILHRLLECIDDPKSCATDLNEVILQDQGLTARVLGYANSAYFGLQSQITDVTSAIVVVGFEAVMDITVGLSLMNGIAAEKKNAELNSVDLWKYSLACGEAAKISANAIGYIRTEQAYIIGLLHDLGKMAFLNCFGEYYEDILFGCRADHSSLVEAEQNNLGFDHSLAGQWLAEKWELPTGISIPVAHHHHLDPLPEEFTREVCLAHLAEYLVRYVQIGSNGEVVDPALHPNVCVYLSLDDADMEQLRTDFAAEVPRLDTIFSTIL